MQNRKRAKQHRNAVVRFCVGAVAVILLAALGLSRMRPVILQYAQNVAEGILLNAADEAVVNVLRDNQIDYDDIVRLSCDRDNRITGLQIDALTINMLKSQIALEIGRIAAAQESFNTSIPIGTFFGSEYTAGHGPKIKFSMQLTSNSAVNFQSEFKDAGLNQVVHRVLLHITVTGRLVFVGQKNTFSVESSALLAETVIVGLTPEAFTEVIGSPSETAGIINDYGAAAGN